MHVDALVAFVRFVIYCSCIASSTRHLLMGILNNIGEYLRGGRTPYSGGVGGQQLHSVRSYFFGRPLDYDYEQLYLNGLWKNSVVASGLDWLSRNWLIPELQVVRVSGDGIEDPIRDHGALDLLKRPHAQLNYSSLSSSYIRDVLCYGSSWIEKEYNSIGDVIGLKPWNPHTVTAVYPDDGSEYLSFWLLNVNGRDLRVSPERVIFSRRHIDVENDRLGWSPLRSVLREISALNEGVTYTDSLLRNYCVPGLIVSPKGDFMITDKDALRVKEVLKDSSTGNNTGDPVVLSGSYEIQKASFSPAEVGLGQLLGPARDTVLAAMGLNADVLGLSGVEKGSYGSYSEAIRAAYVHGLIPLQRLFAEDLSRQLLVDFEDPDDVHRGRVKFSFDYSPVEELDDREQVAANRSLRLYQAGAISLNEARDIVGYGPASTPEADLVGIAKDLARVELGLSPVAGGVVSEGDGLGGVKSPPQRGSSSVIPADGQERSKLEGERNSDSLSPSRSGVNKEFASWLMEFEMEGVADGTS